MEKNYQNYLDQIIEFNSDKALIAMRERYNEPSFFEIISKQRSETTFSAFLKWLFQGNSTMFGHNAPIMMLLDTLEELISIGAEELRKSILSYDISGDTNFTRHFVELLRVRFQAAIGKVNEG